MILGTTAATEIIIQIIVFSCFSSEIVNNLKKLMHGWTNLMWKARGSEPCWNCLEQHRYSIHISYFFYHGCVSILHYLLLVLLLTIYNNDLQIAQGTWNHLGHMKWLKVLEISHSPWVWYVANGWLMWEYKKPALLISGTTNSEG